MNKQKQQRLLKIVFFLSIFGVLISGYLTYLHYSNLNSPCDLSETFQCSLVKQSKYAEIFGIPIALVGLLGYSLLGFIGINLWKNKSWEHRPINKVNLYFLSSKALFIFSLIAVAISLYLTYAEFFLIKALCLFCLISQVNIIAIAGISYKNFSLHKKVI